MRSTVELAAIPSLLLTVDGREYTVEFPLSSVLFAEEKLGRPLKTLQDWFGLECKDIQGVLVAGLRKHHARESENVDVAARICETLNPEALDEVQYALCKLAFPRRKWPRWKRT